MKNLIAKVILAASVLTLTGCYIPGKFESRIHFDKSGDYTLAYEGTIGNALGLLALADSKSGKLHPNDEKMIEGDSAVFKKDPSFKSVKYLGNAQFQVKYEKQAKAGQMTNWLQLLQVSRDKEGNYVVTSAKIEPGKDKELERMKYDIKGTLEVVLPANADILVNNGQSKRNLFGPNSITWAIDKNMKTAVQLKFKIKA